jgi:hypothetical protein
MPAAVKKKTKAPDVPPNAFIGRATKPRDADVAAALGDAKKLWDQTVGELQREFDLTLEWTSYSAKYGWSLRLKKKDRNIVYFGPYSGGFAVSLILGAKALAVAKKNLPAPVFAKAKKYPEGTAIRREMKSADDIAVVKKLVEAKMI